MDIALQYLINGLMLGVMYALVAVGFTLFFGVLDVIKFSHGDVLTVGAFTALATFLALQAAGLGSHSHELAAMPPRDTFTKSWAGFISNRRSPTRSSTPSPMPSC